ncbi:MAG: hypothetical protein WAX22_07050 [Lactococcus hircilactis]
MTKLTDIEKKKMRAEAEIERAKALVAKQQALIKTKEEEVKLLESQYISESLIQSGLSFEEFKSLISDIKSEGDLS